MSAHLLVPHALLVLKYFDYHPVLVFYCFVTNYYKLRVLTPVYNFPVSAGQECGQCSWVLSAVSHRLTSRYQSGVPTSLEVGVLCQAHSGHGQNSVSVAVRARSFFSLAVS